MLIVRSLVTLKTLLLGLLLLASASHASPVFEAFTEARFNRLVEAGEPVLVDVHADWCPTCRRQEAVLTSFQQEHSACGLTILRVDFDAQKEWVKHFRAPRQSTLILFTKGEQSWFSVAETRTTAINEALLFRLGAC
jgi:thioredoxin 1